MHRHHHRFDDPFLFDAATGGVAQTTRNKNKQAKKKPSNNETM